MRVSNGATARRCGGAGVSYGASTRRREGAHVLHEAPARRQGKHGGRWVLTGRDAWPGVVRVHPRQPRRRRGVSQSRQVYRD